MIARVLCGLVMLCVAAFAGAQNMPMKTTIKGVSPEINGISADRDNLAGNETGWVILPFVWSNFVMDTESAQHYANIAACAPPDIRYTAYGLTECFAYANVKPLDDEVQAYAARGVRILGTFVFAPAYARIPDATCQLDGLPMGDGEFARRCAPANDGSRDIQGVAGTTWAKVAAHFVAHRYGSMVQAWIIGNEVNAADYFRTGCSDCAPGAPQEHWKDLYSAYFNASYDGIADGYADASTTYQRLDGAGARIAPRPPVMASMAGGFDPLVDSIVTGGRHRGMSLKTFLRGLDARAGGRAWRVAEHAYPPDWNVPVFSVDDITCDPNTQAACIHDSDFAGPPPPGFRGGISHGTVGAVVGWLRSEFPARPDLWHIFMTEGGLNSKNLANPAANYDAEQASALCDLFANYTGTPGVEAVIYHRMKDHLADEIRGFGLFEESGAPKPAWTTFALANRYAAAGVPGPSCGFQFLPYTRIQRANTTTGHRFSSRVLPKNAFGVEAAWYLFHDARPNTQPLYECWVGQPNHGRTYATPDANCDGRAGALNLGPVGFAYTPDQPHPVLDATQWVMLYACNVGGVDDIVTTDPNCEGYPPARALGWARTSTSNLDNSRFTLLRRSSAPPYWQHWTTTVQPPPQHYQELTWKILREPAAGTKLYYECEIVGGNHSMPSEREDCEGQLNRGPLGYIAQSQQGPNSVPLYRCGLSGFDHMVSSSATCEGYANEGFLGWSSD